jgi:zinc transporter ZupT
LSKKDGKADILISNGLDTKPEPLAIYVTITAGLAFAIALLIGIQNIAAYKEMRTRKTAFTNSKRLFMLLVLYS